MPVLGARPYTVKRFDRTVTDGVVVATESDEFTVVGTIQPLTPEELLQFPEGFRRRARFKFYVQPTADLRLGGIDIESEEDNEPDRIVYRGKLLHLHGDSDYSQAVLIPHRKLILVQPETEITGVADG